MWLTPPSLVALPPSLVALSRLLRIAMSEAMCEASAKEEAVHKYGRASCLVCSVHLLAPWMQ